MQALSLAFLYMTGSQAQLLDTSLIQYHASPYFYNLIKAADGKVYAGTSDGILWMKGYQMKRVDDRKGYLTLGPDGQLAIDTNGVQYHDQRMFAHLLPFPDESRVEYHAGDKEFFYIAAGGRMHIYRIQPYDYQYRNHSVRTISRHFVGTYSGLYFNGRRIPFPSFTDGYIREYHGKAFVCYSAMAIYRLVGDDSLSKANMPKPEGFDYRHVRDLRYSLPYNSYFISTATQLGILDTALTQARTLLTAESPDQDVVLIGDDRRTFLFAAGKRFHRYYNGEVQTVVDLPEAIKDGVPTHLSHYLLTSKGLYAYRSSEKLEKLVSLQSAHTLLLLPGSELVIGTDNGLYLYNLISRRLSVLVNGVEFNRRALHLEDGLVYAGAVNGLYVLDAKRLDEIVSNAKAGVPESQLPAYLKATLAVLALLTSLLTYLWWNARARMARALEESRRSGALTEEGPVLPDKGQVEDFIRQQLNVANLKVIQEHFNLSTRQLYGIVQPEKPGAMIQRVRLERVVELKKEGIAAKDIAVRTGLSESYIRQIWHDKEQP